MSKRSLDIIIAAHNKTRRTFGQVETGLQGMRSSMLNVRNLAIGGLGLFALVRATKSAVATAAEFGREMATVGTMLTMQTEHHLPEFSREIRRMTVEFGQGSKTLTKGAFDILSASISAADAMEVLRVSAKAAVGGVTETGIAVDGITTLLNAYGLEADQAEQVSDRMFATVKRGKITFAELAANIGKVAPMARAAGMGMEDMLAGIATLTRQGLSAEESTTRLVAIIKQMPEAAGDLEKLVSGFRGMNLGEIMRILPESRAASGMAALAADIEGLTRDMGLMRRAAGSTAEAFDRMAAEPAFQLDQTKRLMEDLSRSMGDAVIPTVLLFTQELMDNRKELEEWGEGLAQRGIEVARWLAANRKLVIGFAKTAAAIGGVIVLGPPLIATIRGIAAASSLLAANPLLALAGAVATAATGFVLWKTAINGTAGELISLKPLVEDLARVNSRAINAADAEQNTMLVKAQRLAELRSSQELSNREMMEARDLADDLAKAFVFAGHTIDRLGRSSKDTAEAMRLLSDESAQMVSDVYLDQLTDAEGRWKQLRAEMRRAAELSEFAGLNPARGDEGFVPMGLEGQVAIDMLTAAQDDYNAKIVEANRLAGSHVDRLEEMAKLTEEITRLRARQRGTGTGVVGELAPLDPAERAEEFKRVNSDLLAHLEKVRTGLIRDDLARQIARLTLDYQKRIAVATKAGKDISILEQARDVQIRQAREAAEKKANDERLSREKSLGADIARLRITTTKHGLDREIGLLKLQQAQELALARSTAEQRLILMKFDLLTIEAQRGVGGPRLAPRLLGRLETASARGRDPQAQAVEATARNTATLVTLSSRVAAASEQMATVLNSLLNRPPGGLIPVLGF